MLPEREEVRHEVAAAAEARHGNAQLRLSSSLFGRRFCTRSDVGEALKRAPASSGYHPAQRRLHVLPAIPQRRRCLLLAHNAGDDALGECDGNVGVAGSDALEHGARAARARRKLDADARAFECTLLDSQLPGVIEVLWDAHDAEASERCRACLLRHA